jgi:hypothetical protein
MMNGIDLNPKLETILAKDLDESEKIAQAFKYLISEHIKIAKRQIELFNALGNKEDRVKEQIKANTMDYCLNVFTHCYNRVTGRKINDE